MKIDNEFGVDVPVERAWEALTDLEGLAPCMPGAQLTGVEGDVYSGKVRIKVGPVISQFSGTARFVEKDEDKHSAVISAAGKDTRGGGNASATITALLRPDGARTLVSVSTDLNISGKLAQFGSGMIKEISEKLFAQFVANVEKQLLAEPAGPAESAESAGSPAPSTPPSAPAQPQEPAAAPAAAPVPDPVAATARASAAEPAPAVRPVPSPAPESVSRTAAEPLPEPERAVPAARPAAAREDEDEGEPLDLMRLAGKSVYKRLIPVAAGAVVVGVVIYLLVR
ncbi:SRPBCC family protein [Streptomyces sp. NPDC026672]|uniref:SRPBCC family protein n=1 Tax=unclassified Streptomyces TaxID=2593676 RepID=UPI0033F5584A